MAGYGEQGSSPGPQPPAAGVRPAAGPDISPPPRARLNRRRFRPADMDIVKAVLADADVVQRYLVLLADAGGGEPVRGRTKLQKMMFMASKADDELDREGCFEPDNYGPYSEVVDGELEYLASIGVLRIASGGIGITRAGRRIAKRMSKEVGANTPLMLANLKELLNDLPTREVLAYIYAAYPETTSESVEYQRIRPQMERIMVSLIRKEKITSGHAAELLGKPRHYVIELMKEAGIAYLH